MSPHSATSVYGREESWKEEVGCSVVLGSGVALECHIRQAATRALLSLQNPNHVSLHYLPHRRRTLLQSCCPHDRRGQQWLPFTPRGLVAALVLACVTHLKRVWGFGTPPLTCSWDWVSTPSPKSCCESFLTALWATNYFFAGLSAVLCCDIKGSRAFTAVRDVMSMKCPAGLLMFAE